MSEANIDLQESETTLLDQAKILFGEKEYEQSYIALHEYWLKDIEDAKAVGLFADLMQAMEKPELSEKAKTLCQSLGSDEASAEQFFDLGFILIDERQFDLASLLLQKCVQLVPDDPTINYELGYALMNLKQFDQALSHFEKAAVNSFDCKLNIAVCLTMLRDLDKAKVKVDELALIAREEEEKQEVAQQKMIIKRLSEFSKGNELSVRDWLYALYGSVGLNNQNAQDENGVLPYGEIARTLVTLVGLMSELGESFAAIEFYNLYAKPLAEALGELMGLPVQSFQGAQRSDRALCVIAWASEIVGPHQSFIDHDDKRTLFAYGLSASDPLPLTPELVANVSNVCIMPWDERFAAQFFDYGVSPNLDDITTRLQEDPQAAADIVNEARKIETRAEILQVIDSLVKYYKVKRPNLIFGNHENFSKRSPYTAEIPGI
jgi:tetratricopeptide (TPR) repeat protein